MKMIRIMMTKHKICTLFMRNISLTPASKKGGKRALSYLSHQLAKEYPCITVVFGNSYKLCSYSSRSFLVAVVAGDNEKSIQVIISLHNKEFWLKLSSFHHETKLQNLNSIFYQIYKIQQWMMLYKQPFGIFLIFQYARLKETCWHCYTVVIPFICNFFTPTHVKAWKCVNLQQKLSRDKTS